MLKIRNYGKFISINILIASLIATRYFHFLPEMPDSLLDWLFIITGTFSQMALLGAAVALLALPCAFLPGLARKLSISAIATLVIALLFVDTNVFAQYRFHINAVVLEMFMAGQVIEFPISMWLMAGAGVALLWALEYGLLHLLERSPTAQSLKTTRKFGMLVILSLLTCNSMHVWAAAHAYQPITQIKRYLPLFYPATSNSTMRKYGWVDEEALERQKLLTAQKQNSDLRYPVQPLQVTAVEKPVNLVFLVIDSWRAETFNAENTPNLWKFAQSGRMLNQHMSTGNATRVGIFGMFYGLPGSYWHSMLDNRTSPLFMDRLQALNYQLGIFASAQLNNPEFDQTVFSKVTNLRTTSPGASAVERDIAITNEWMEWFKHSNKNQPSFSFLFYDAPHGYEYPKDYPHRYEPLPQRLDYTQRTPNADTQPWINAYKTSVHFVDSQAQKVLDTLQASGVLDHTIVIITGDHGEEINDNGLNYWGHNSNFSDIQVKVPFVMVGQGLAADARWQGLFTSHADIVPTLMKNYLGVQSPVQDFSTGIDLLGAPMDRDWVLSSGYSQYAIVGKDRILEVGAAGQFQLVDKRYRPLKDSPNFEHVQQAMEQMSRFNK